MEIMGFISCILSNLTNNGCNDWASYLHNNQWNKRFNLKFRKPWTLLLSSGVRPWTVCCIEVQTDNKVTGWLCGKPDAIFHRHLYQICTDEKENEYADLTQHLPLKEVGEDRSTIKLYKNLFSWKSVTWLGLQSWALGNRLWEKE